MYNSKISNQIARKPFGVLLLCTGKRGNLIRNCLRSLQKTNPLLPFHLLADRPYDVPFQWVESWIGKASRRIKTQLYRYSPFDVTLFADDDTIFQKPINIEEMLGKADIAVAVDAFCEALKDCAGVGVYQEMVETISMCGESSPFYNSGVMLWRNSAAVHAFFDEWHKEWLKYKSCDQYAFLRALKSSGLKLEVIPQSYNSGVRFRQNGNSKVKDAHIYHLLDKSKDKENAGRLLNLMNPTAAGPFETAFVRAVNSGLMAENQYQYIARDLHDNEKCSLLIISNGPDYDLWDQASEGNLLYVQGNPGYHFTSQNNPVHYRFGGRVGHWVSVPVPPDNINKPWDFVIVDAPVGHNKSCPGRQIPIAWASQLAQKAIFVHDYERPWERKVCDRYLGTPSRIIDSKSLNNHQLAVFRLKKQASCATPTLSIQSSQGQPVNSLSCPICETSTSAGIFYISIGDLRHDFLRAALESARRMTPELQVHAASDIPLEIPFTWVAPRLGHSSRFYKTQAYSLSPFELTLQLDDDTIIHRPLGDLTSILGNADVAMVQDSFWPTIGCAIAAVKSAHWVCQDELKMMAACGYVDEINYNSGMMLYRKTERMELLFKTWFREWCRFQTTDQFALIRALKITGVNVRCLPLEYNLPFRRHLKDKACILHATAGQKENYLAEYTRSYSLEMPKVDPVYAAFLDCVKKGMRSQYQYEVTGRIINSLHRPKIVVFGCGYDSLFLAKLTNAKGGTAYFVEDQDKWITFAAQRGIENIIKVTYSSRIGELTKGVCVQKQVQAQCEEADLIIVDGPVGGKCSDKGREIPIMLAARSKSQPTIIVYNYERPWERYCCDNYLNRPEHVISGKLAHKNVMAIWCQNRIALTPLLQ